MKTLKYLAMGGSVLAAALSSSAWAQQPSADFGRATYDTHCASCHGSDGKGSGPVKPHLVKAPSDLTTLAKRSGGAMPVQLIWEVIDGRATQDLGPHGNREMPVWGNTFRAEALAGERTAGQPEWYVRDRIVSLIDYLQLVQVN